MTMGLRAACVLSLVVLAVTANNRNQKIEWECYVSKPKGRVVPLKGSGAHVKLPCKYRLADMRCQHHHIKVTTGNKVDLASGAVIPSTMWIKIVNTNNGDTVKAFTTLEHILMYKQGLTDNAWIRREGNFASMGYSTVVRGAYVLVNWDITMDFKDRSALAKVSCNARYEDFENSPQTLCGDGSSSEALQQAANSMFGNTTTDPELAKDLYFHFLVMNDDSITQSKTCREMADRFQSCEEKDKPIAVEQCHHIFADTSTAAAQNLSVQDLTDQYLDCLDSVCSAA